jgi:hypothetical protein
LDLEPEFLETPDESVGDLRSIAAMEVISAEIAVFDAVAEHVVRGSEH